MLKQTEGYFWSQVYFNITPCKGILLRKINELVVKYEYQLKGGRNNANCTK